MILWRKLPHNAELANYDRGYFTIQGTDKFWSENFNDKTIEQDLCDY